VQKVYRHYRLKRRDYDLFGDDAYGSCDEIIDDEPQDQSNNNNNVPEVCAHNTPHLGMQFDSDDAAHKFFNDYASIGGFAIRKSGNYHAIKEESSGHTRLTI
jgi:hypothetical protein